MAQVVETPAASLSSSALYLREIRISTTQFNLRTRFVRFFNWRAGPHPPPEHEPRTGLALMRAAEVLLEPVLRRSGTESTLFQQYFPPGPQDRQSSIIGVFRDRDTDAFPGGFKVKLEITRGEGGCVFEWNGVSKSFARVRSLLEQYGWTSNTVIFLKPDFFVNGTMPIDFISGAYGTGRAASIKKSLSYLEEVMADVTEARDMLGISKLLHSAAVDQIRELDRELQENANLLELQEQFSTMAKYSKKIRLAERSAVIRADIETQEDLVRVEEIQERNRITGLEDQMARLAVDVAAVCELDPAETGRLTLERALGTLRRDLEEKRAALATLEPQTGDFESPASDVERARAADVADGQSAMLSKRDRLTSLEAERRLVAARLKILQDHALIGEADVVSREDLQSRIDLLTVRHAQSVVDGLDITDQNMERRDRLREITLERAQIGERAADTEQRLLTLIRDDIVATHEAKTAHFQLLSGSSYEILDAEFGRTANRAFLRVLEAISPILDELGVPFTVDARKNFGFFGAVIDHIDVEQQRRGILRPLQKLLTTFLVRDDEVAGKLRDKIQQVEFEDAVHFISLEKYKRTPRTTEPPAGTTKVSTHLIIRPSIQYPLVPGEVDKLRNVIACESEDYFVVEGVPDVASARARELSRDAQWRSCTFVTHDGTCFHRNVQFPTVRTDALSAYERIWEYWAAKQAEVNARFNEFNQARDARELVEQHTLNYLQATRDKLQEIDSLRNQIQWFDDMKRRLDREDELVYPLLTDLKAEIESLGPSVEGGSTDALKAQLEARLEKVDLDITQLHDEIRERSDTVSRAIINKVEAMINATRMEEKDVKITQLRDEIPLLETQIREAEEFFQRYHQLENEEAQEPVPPVEAVETRRWFAANTPVNRTRLFLLKQKLAEIEQLIQEDGLVQPPGWNPNEDYARRLRRIDMTLRCKVIPPAGEYDRQGIDDFVAIVQPVTVDTEAPDEYLREIFDTAQLNVNGLPSGRDSVYAALRYFETTVRTFRPNTIVYAKPRHSGRRRLTPAMRVEEFNLLELAFDGNILPARTLTPAQSGLFLISAIAARAQLCPPVFIAIDDPDDAIYNQPDLLKDELFRLPCEIVVIRRYPPQPQVTQSQSSTEPSSPEVTLQE